MAKRAGPSGMTAAEKIGGGMILAVYLFLPSQALDPLWNMLESAFSFSPGEALRDGMRCYILFVLTAAVFRRGLGRDARSLIANGWRSLAAVSLGLVAFYGLNELVWRLLQVLRIEQLNLNDQAILARLESSPHQTVLMVVFLSPVIEEALFRGYVFGGLRVYSRGGAYAASCVLFALVHVWPYFAGGWDLRCLPVAVQYMAPGAVMAWTYERSESVWGSVLLHMAVNALAVWRAI